MMYSDRARAKTLLGHYLDLIAKASGVHLDSDCHAEIRDIVDCIIDAAIEEIEKKKEQRP
jgi:hypothetical protein